ncbi:MAG: hypothetical protein H3C31_07110 [Brumimicrobium sp.]|nr:hypothetical protein [Brumimicrobium sp.]
METSVITEVFLSKFVKSATFFHSIFLLILLNTQVYSQMIDNSYGQVFTDKPYFNENFIQKMKIKSISGLFWNYKLGDKLRNTEYFKYFEFNQKGQLIADYESLQNTKNDTLIQKFEYTENGDLKSIKVRDKYGYYFHIYEYNKDHQVVRYIYKRSYDRCYLSPDKISLDDDDIIAMETYSYEKYDNQIKQITYNQSNLPYKEAISYYTSDNQLEGKLERLLRTSQTTRTSYHYNEKKKLDTLIISSKLNDNNNLLYVFSYDDTGKLLKKEIHRNNEYTTQYQIIYKDDSNFINDILIQDLNTNFIRVIKLRDYKYFD